ncbi:uncharacterized protein [Ptychodera flava]|uniref:uncharacterized protein n=1 Tax=Ptychodera flava TaxID=63121 RepID=UPI003969CA5F
MKFVSKHTFVLVMVLLTGKSQAQHRPHGTCALNDWKGYNNAILNIEITPNRPCDQQLLELLAQIEGMIPIRSGDTHLVTGLVGGKIRAVQVAVDKLDTADLGEKVSDEILDCKMCHIDWYEGYDAKIACNSVQECPLKLSDGLYWNPPGEVTLSLPNMNCYYVRQDQTDVYLCKNTDN